MEDFGPHEDQFREFGVSESAGLGRVTPLLLIAPPHRATNENNAGGSGEVKSAFCCYTWYWMGKSVSQFKVEECYIGRERFRSQLLLGGANIEEMFVLNFQIFVCEQNICLPAFLVFFKQICEGEMFLICSPLLKMMKERLRSVS